MKATTQLLLAHQPRVCTPEDFREVALWVQEHDPTVHATAVTDRIDGSQAHGEILDLPTTTVAPARLLSFRPPHGTVLVGPDLPKDDEYRALELAGLPVPKWALLTRESRPDLDGFGRYVVVKPARSGRGADVRIMRRGRVRWRRPNTEFTLKNNPGDCRWIVQDFVYTGRWPVSYRVATLFGTVLWAWRTEASRDRSPLHDREAFDTTESSGVSIVASGRGCRFTLCFETDVIALAQRAHAAFPDVPLLGVDVLRDVDSGRLYLIEVNSSGFTWHFSSPVGLGIQADSHFRLEHQFNGRALAAEVLAGVCRRHATREPLSAGRRAASSGTKV